MRRRIRTAAPVVITDVCEPLAVRHGRLIRRHLVLLVVWILAFVASGFVADDLRVTMGMVSVSGLVLWAAVFVLTDDGSSVGRREPPQRPPAAMITVRGAGATSVSHELPDR